MRVLFAHNYYQRRGGEDVVFENEARLLEERGHDVIRHVVTNQDISSLRDKAAAFANVIWNPAAAHEMRALIEDKRPDVLHVHNFFPLLSPSIYEAARASGVAVVQTLHNYRLGCAAGFLYRGNAPCEQCIGRLPFAAVTHRCYRDSYVGSLAVAGMITAHSLRRTWHRSVDRFIALTEFSRSKLIEIGLPADRLLVKPNFVPDHGVAREAGRNGALFVGRLSQEKGIADLVHAWRGVGRPLTIAGTGPLEQEVRAASIPGIRVLGQQAHDELFQSYRGASFIVLPSIGYESMPMTLLEAWSTGLPAIAFRHSAFAEMIEDGVNGLLAPPGDISALMARITWAHDNPEAMAVMGRAARHSYERKHSPDINYDMLMAVYHGARGAAHVRPSTLDSSASYAKKI